MSLRSPSKWYGSRVELGVPDCEGRYVCVDHTKSRGL